jgi:protein-L-isoaspartate(D-aspartate) O-methyltransferase
MVEKTFSGVCLPQRGVALQTLPGSEGADMKSSFYVALSLCFIGLAGCQREAETRSDIYDLQRRNMVRWDLKEKGIQSKAVLAAVQAVPRHLFLDFRDRKNAYKNEEIQIAQFVQTPTPFVAAKTIDLLNLTDKDKVLEVGTGRGYQTAILAELAKEVYTIEIVNELYKTAQKTLSNLNYKNVHCRVGDGYAGWPEAQPFDAILVTAGAKEVPEPLLHQLAVGGRLVMPIGDPKDQTLVLYRKTGSGIKQEKVLSVKIGSVLEGTAAGNNLRTSQTDTRFK